MRLVCIAGYVLGVELMSLAAACAPGTRCIDLKGNLGLPAGAPLFCVRTLVDWVYSVRYLRAMCYGEPTVVKGVCLRRGGCEKPLDWWAEVSDVDADVYNVSSYTYLDKTKPLFHVKGAWEDPRLSATRQTLRETGGAFYASEAPRSPLARRLERLAKLDELGANTTVWVGRGSAAAAHYDASFNVFALLAGEKTFELWPPLDDPQSTYSYLHPLFRRVFDVRHPVTSIALGPGDVLLLPEYWIHRVSTPADTVSLAANAWHRSAAVDDVRAIVDTIGSRLSAGSLEATATVLASFVDVLLESLGLSRAWFARGLEARLGFLGRRFGKILRPETSRLAAWCRADGATRVRIDVNGVVTALEALPEGPRRLEAANLIEAAVYDAIRATESPSPTRHAVAFLLTCFGPQEMKDPSADL